MSNSRKRKKRREKCLHHRPSPWHYTTIGRSKVNNSICESHRTHGARLFAVAGMLVELTLRFLSLYRRLVSRPWTTRGTAGPGSYVEVVSAVPVQYVCIGHRRWGRSPQLQEIRLCVSIRHL